MVRVHYLPPNATLNRYGDGADRKSAGIMPRKVRFLDGAPKGEYPAR